MSTTELFKKHFGNTAAVDMKHPNMESFFEELNAECLEEDKHKNCNIHDVSQQRELLYGFITWYNAKPKVQKGEHVYTTDVDEFLKP